jgi:hypothetical protein
MSDLSDALCRGRWELFDSIATADHIEARAICAECPALLACDAKAAEMLDTYYGRKTPSGGLVGTWAGKLYGAPVPFAPKPRECGTNRGYYQHRHRGEGACAMCKAAHAADRKSSRKAAS